MKQNKAEKLLAGVLSISLAMGVSVMPAFAAQVQGPPYEDMSRVYLTKNYELANTGTISPEETFTFTIDPDTVTDASEGIEAADYKPIVGDVTYAQGEAGSANKTKQIEIQLPEYDSVGVYTYIIHEAAGDSAGVTYYGDAILLRVTVIEQDGKLRIAAVHTEDPESTGEGKKDDFDNLYYAGELEQARRIQRMLLKLRGLVRSVMPVMAHKKMLELQGFHMGPARFPFRDLSGEESRTIEEGLEKLLGQVG